MKLIDVIREEIQRQGDDNMGLNVSESLFSTRIRVDGEIDLEELANAVLEFSLSFKTDQRM